MFEITKLGQPCSVFGIGYLLLVGKRLLPERKPAQQVFENPLEYTLELEVSEKSPLIGHSIASPPMIAPLRWIASIVPAAWSKRLKKRIVAQRIC